MNLYEYFKALTMNKNRMLNPVTISVDESRNLASISYNLISPQFSWDIPWMKSARGLIVDTLTGEVVARPYPKFFNYGENKMAYWPDNTEGMVIEDKLDGSLVIITTHKDKLLVASSASLLSDHADLFNTYIENNLSPTQYQELLTLGKTYTILCEYVGPNNKVVLQYPEENMILHGVIKTDQPENQPTIEVPYQQLQEIGSRIGLEVVEQHPLKSFSDVYNYLDTVTGIEGFVVKFADGHRLKFKTDEYTRMHKVATDLDLTIDSRKLREAFVISIMNTSYDDLIPFLSVETNQILTKMVSEYKEYLTEAIRKKDSYLKSNKHIEIKDAKTSIDTNAIRAEINNLSASLTSVSELTTKKIADYLNSTSNDILIEKGYAKIELIINEKDAEEKRISTAYTAKNIKNGLINTQELTRKQKALVSQDESVTIKDKHIKKYLYGGDLITSAIAYLNEAYVTNVELSETQKKRIQLKEAKKLTKIVSKFTISEELQERLLTVLAELETELTPEEEPLQES